VLCSRNRLSAGNGDHIRKGTRDDRCAYGRSLIFSLTALDDLRTLRNCLREAIQLFHSRSKSLRKNLTSSNYYQTDMPDRKNDIHLCHRCDAEMVIPDAVSIGRPISKHFRLSAETMSSAVFFVQSRSWNSVRGRRRAPWLLESQSDCGKSLRGSAYR